MYWHCGMKSADVWRERRRLSASLRVIVSPFSPVVGVPM